MSLRRSLPFLLSFTVLGACGGGGGGTTETTTETTETSGSETATTETAPPSPYAGAIASTDTALGESKYTARCGGCHNNGAPVLTNIGWTPEALRRQIREGSGDMPAIGAERLSDEEMEAVLAYLGTIGGVGEHAGDHDD